MAESQYIHPKGDKQKDLWDDWIMFKKNDYTYPTLQLKK